MLDLLAGVGTAVGAVVLVLGIVWRIARPHVRAFVEEAAQARRKAEAVEAVIAPAKGDDLAQKVEALGREVHACRTEVTAVKADLRSNSLELSGIRDGMSWAGRALDSLARTVDGLERDRKERQ